MAEQEQTHSPGATEPWERQALTNLAKAALDEQRRSRRWGIFFKSLGFAYLFVVLALLFGGQSQRGASAGREHTALVDVQGMIADFAESNADNIVSALRRAFEAENSKGVLLRINSPGGSPVQAAYVYDEIRRLKEAYPDKPVYAVVTDMCASGGYYIAAAADGIYANRSSVVGSVGVIMNGFGFTGTMDKLGVDRRLYTAGEHKGFLDPFSPEQESEVAHIQKLLDDIHKHFVTAVKEGRGDRLKEHPDLFSGLVWTGEQSVELGLVDGLGSPAYVAREVIGAEEIINYTPKPEVLERIAQRIGASFSGAIRESLTGFTLR